jgi:hypothetical protein
MAGEMNVFLLSFKVVTSHGSKGVLAINIVVVASS